MTPVLGVRIKSGWAATVLLGGTRDQPVVLDARRLDLADPDTPATNQPHHAGTGTPQRDDRILRRLIGLIERRSRANAAALIGEHRAAGHAPRLATVVGTSDTDPATISNPHIRIHALEGRLFRRVAEQGLAAAGLRCSVVLERSLLLAAPEQLGHSGAELARALTALRPAGGGPWRHEQKMAALAAWMGLGKP
jgi:hypothetical protein